MTRIRPQNAIRGPKFVLRRKQGPHDLHSAVCWAIGFKCATNNFKQRRKGNLGGQNCSNREHEYIHRPKIVKTCFTCRRYTVKSHAGENQQHACYYGGTPMRHRKTACFEALVLELHFAQSCSRFLLLYCLLGWRDFAATPQGCCACVGQVVVCRAASLHFPMLRQKSEKRP